MTSNLYQILSSTPMKKHFHLRNLLLLTAVFFSVSPGSTSLASHYIEDGVYAKEQLLAALGPEQSEILHFISHGKPGELLINGQWLDAHRLVRVLHEQIITNQGVNQINIYGCEFGQGTVGKAAVAYLEKTLKVHVAASDDITGHDGDWELEVGSPTQRIGTLENYPFNLQYASSDDFDGDGVINSLDLDDDNDGVLDSEEKIVPSPVCSLHYPSGASTSIVSSATAFPAARELVNTYDNDLGTFGGAGPRTAQLIGTVTYTYTVPLNEVTEFKFFSNGGGVLNDGQVTNIASVKFFDSANNLLYQADNIVIPQANITTPYILSFPTPLQGVVSFTLTDLTDQMHGTNSEAIWKDVNLTTCITPDGDIDTDNDGVANRFDLDSDGDGCPDSQEASVVSSFPGIPFASPGVINSGGSQPAALSQINLATFQDTNLNGYEDRLETLFAGAYAGTYSYTKATDDSDAICVRDLDSDGDNQPDSTDLDDDNDGILDTAESSPAVGCVLNYPNDATTTVIPSATQFPAGRVLANTYDNNLATFGGAGTNTPSLIGTVTYLYNTPLDQVTEFQFFSNGGSVLTDGQVTNIASIKFYNSANQLLHQADNIVIPQASSQTPYLLTFPTPLQGVASFSLTDLTDQTHAGNSEAIWKDVNLRTCPLPADLDTDHDGIVNRLDLDSDGDGCPDSQEASVVGTFANVPFANIHVINVGGATPALASQVVSASFQDGNSNGFDDRFETGTAGVYTGAYTYAKALDNATAACTPLPVTLISFTAKINLEGNLLHWETTQEKGFDRFSIEKSADLTKGFMSIGTVKGGLNRYDFIDPTVDKGHSYYRLKMIDLDGSSAYSRIVHLYQPYGENEHTVFPNPGIKHTVYIHNYFPIQSVSVYDMLGNPVRIKTSKHTTSYQFDIDPNAAPGLYILQYQVGAEQIRRKFSLN